MNLAPFHNSLIYLFTSIKFSRLLLALDTSSTDRIEIPEFDEEIIRICSHLNNIKKLNTSTEQLIENIQTDLSLISDFNKSFLEIASSKRPAKWIGEVRSIFYPENESMRKKGLSFLLLNNIFYVGF